MEVVRNGAEVGTQSGSMGGYVLRSDPKHKPQSWITMQHGGSTGHSGYVQTLILVPLLSPAQLP